MLHPGLHQPDIVSQCLFSWYMWVPSVIFSVTEPVLPSPVHLYCPLVSTAVVQRPSGKKVFTVMLSLSQEVLPATNLHFLALLPTSQPLPKPRNPLTK